MFIKQKYSLLDLFLYILVRFPIYYYYILLNIYVLQQTKALITCYLNVF